MENLQSDILYWDTRGYLMPQHAEGNPDSGLTYVCHAMYDVVVLCLTGDPHNANTILCHVPSSNFIGNNRACMHATSQTYMYMHVMIW